MQKLKTFLKNLFNSHIQLALASVLMLLIALLCAIASIIDHLKGANSAQKIYYSWGFFALLAGFCILVLAAFFRKKILKNPSLFLIHISFLFILFGAAISHFFGYSATIFLQPQKPTHQALGELTKLQICQNNQCASSFDIRAGLALNGLQIRFKDYSKEGKKIIKNDPETPGEPLLKLRWMDYTKELKKGECMQVKNGRCCLADGLLRPSSELELFSINENEQVSAAGAELGCVVEFAAASAREDFSLFGGNLQLLLLELCEQNAGKSPACRQIKLPLNEQISHGTYSIKWSQISHDLGVWMMLRRAGAINYAGTSNVQDYFANVIIAPKISENIENDFQKAAENGELKEEKISLNKPLDIGKKRFFMHQQNGENAVLLVNSDPGKLPTYAGYILLFTGCLLNAFSLRKKFAAIAAAAALLMLPNPAEAQEAKSAFFAELASTMSVDYSGDITSFYSLAKKVCSRLNCPGESMQTVLKIARDLHFSAEEKLLKISPELAEQLGFSARFLSLADLYDGPRYKLSDKLAAARAAGAAISEEQKELLKLDEAVNIVFLIMHENIFNILVQDGPDGVEFKGLNDDDLSLQNAKLAANYQRGLLLASKTGDYSAALEALQAIKTAAAEHNLRSKARILTDVYLSKLAPFGFLCGFAGFLALGFVGFSLGAATARKSLTARILRALAALQFCLLFLAIAARSYTAGYIALNGTYESLLAIALICSLAAAAFAGLAALCAQICAFAFLLVAAISPAQITSLAPVLNSPYLAYHVGFLSASYAFFAISALLAALCAWQPSAAKALRTELCAHFGLLLLCIGTLLGAVWANETWGRYWAWDNKETWSLITALVYAAILHAKWGAFARGVAYLCAFCCVLFTYFGVNFYLSGLHSYANSSAPSLWYLGLGASVFAAFLAVVFFKKFASRRAACKE